MFRDVPGCSGMFHVPGFIDDQKIGIYLIISSNESKFRYFTP